MLDTKPISSISMGITVLVSIARGEKLTPAVPFTPDVLVFITAL